MDYDEIANISNSSTAPITPTASMKLIAHEIVFSLFAIVAIIASSLIIFTVFRFKRLRTAPYMFLASWAISDLISLLCLPSGFRIISILENFSLPYEVYCIFTQVGAVMHIFTVLFVILVAIDWVVAAYFWRASQKFRKWYKVILAVLWALIVASLVVSVVFCGYHMLHFKELGGGLAITLCGAFLVVTVIQITRLVQKLRKRSSEYPGLAINLATAYLLCWVLSFLHFVFLFGVFYHSSFAFVISFCLVYSSSIINFGLMYRFNNDFAACVRQVWSCKHIKYEEDLTNTASVQNNVNTDSINIDIRCSPTSPRLENTRR